MEQIFFWQYLGNTYRKKQAYIVIWGIEILMERKKKRDEVPHPHNKTFPLSAKLG